MFSMQRLETAKGNTDLNASKGEWLGGTASRGLHGKGKAGF